jgi:hypothetical protein
MPNNRGGHIMRKLFIYCLLPITFHAADVLAKVPEPVAAAAPSQYISLAVLQARFAKLQQVARPHDLPFELRFVDESQVLLGQHGDGIVRLPQDLAVAAPDGETLNFLMLLGLADAIARAPIRQEPSTATKIITGTLGFIGASIADNRKSLSLPYPQFESSAPSSQPVSASRALTWTTATGGCELRIVAGLHKLETMSGPIGQNARQILKALGAVAWTPNDRCGPPAY